MVVRIKGGPSTSKKKFSAGGGGFGSFVPAPKSSFRAGSGGFGGFSRSVPSQPIAPAPRSTPRPNGGLNLPGTYNTSAPRPGGGLNLPGAYAPAPSTVYQPAQIQSFAPAQQNFAPQNFSAPQEFSAPLPPPRPPRKVYDRDSWLAGDADYKEQTTEYDRALNSFRNRINAKKQQFDQDYNQSKSVTEKNQQFTLNDLGEDFGARGLSYSGLFDQTKERTQDQFRNQLANLLQMRTRNRNQADEEFSDFSTETNLRKANALRQAIARMAQAQALSDMELGY